MGESSESKANPIYSTFTFDLQNIAFVADRIS